jgi:hypothetical protein
MLQHAATFRRNPSLAREHTGSFTWCRRETVSICRSFEVKAKARPVCCLLRCAHLLIVGGVGQAQVGGVHLCREAVRGLQVHADAAQPRVQAEPRRNRHLHHQRSTHGHRETDKGSTEEAHTRAVQLKIQASDQMEPDESRRAWTDMAAGGPQLPSRRAPSPSSQSPPAIIRATCQPCGSSRACPCSKPRREHSGETALALPACRVFRSQAERCFPSQPRAALTWP